MKLFKNGVGRPSKETIRKRKIFCWSAIIASLLVVGIGVYGVLSMYATRLTTAAATTNHKNVIIVVGASQVHRMDKFNYSGNKDKKGNNIFEANEIGLTSYTYGSQKYEKDKNLFFIWSDGSEFDYQTFTNVENGKYSTAGNGLKKVLGKMKDKSKTYHIFFPMPGNSIADYSFGNITNANVKKVAQGYNEAIKYLKNKSKNGVNNYNVKGYVVSVQPVLPKDPNRKPKVVYNTNTLADDATYRSNCKYYKYNSEMMGIVNSSYTTNLKYLPLFKEIVNVGSGGYNYCGTNKATTYTYNKINGVSYGTTDGMHWNNATAKAYTKLMFDKAAIK